MDALKRERIRRQLRRKGCGEDHIRQLLAAFEERHLRDETIEDVLALVKPRPDGEPQVLDVLPDTDGEKTGLEKLLALVDDSEIASIQNVTSGVIRIINDPDSNVRDLKQLIEIDPPLSGKVLRLANSAHFSSQRQISDVERAVVWIGFEHLKEITLNQKVCEIFRGEEVVYGYSRVGLWKHCVAVAVLGKMIYRREFGELGENIYAAGLLHDIGIIAEDQFAHDAFGRVLRCAAEEPCEITQAEEQILGYDHSSVGRSIATTWEFPTELAMAIGYHHMPKAASPEFARMAQTLYVADVACQMRKLLGYTSGFRADRKLQQWCLNELGVQRYALDLLVRDLENELAKLEKEGLFS